MGYTTRSRPGWVPEGASVSKNKIKKKKITFTLHWQFEIKTGHGAAGLGRHAAAHGVPELPS